MKTPPKEQTKPATVADAAIVSNQDAPAPMLPGTEQPRSLGELMRQAEAASQSASEEAEAAGASQPRKRRSKRPGRAQARRFARERALQALYQLDVSNAQVSSLRDEFVEAQDMSRVDVEYFLLLFNGVAHHPDTVDAALHDCLDRPVADLDPIERSVLRIAAFELAERPDIPARVVINEGIEITKRFGADKGHRYVNGVLDKLAMRWRPLEMRSR